jgi:DNA polymerase I-like protein with 3'-5' exonuclease and polymerase domains
MESPLVKTLCCMEIEGILVDKKYLEEMGEEIEMKLIKL